MIIHLNAPDTIYFVIDNLVLWTNLEIPAYAADKCRGMMEYWNGVILGSEG